MSQTSSLPGGDEILPDISSKKPAARQDRTKSDATRSRDDQQSKKKPSIFARIAQFVREVISEMKKVTYPTRDELWTYFLVVIVFVVALMAFTGTMDLGFRELSTIVFG